MGLSRRSTLAATLALAATAGAPAARAATRGLSNPMASAEARALYGFFWSLYGRRTLTGQQEMGVARAGPRVKLDYIERVTGKQPAILGLDYLEPRDNAAVNERATAWSRSGGIVL